MIVQKHFSYRRQQTKAKAKAKKKKKAGERLGSRDRSIERAEDVSLFGDRKLSLTFFTCNEKTRENNQVTGRLLQLDRILIEIAVNIQDLFVCV